MNKQRRKDVDVIIGQIDDLKMDIDDVISDEQDTYFNLPDSLQASEKGDKYEEAIALMESSKKNLDIARGFLIKAKS